MGYLALYAPDPDDRWPLMFEVGDWCFSLDAPDLTRLLGMVQGLLAETLFDPVVFHRDGDLEELANGGGPLDVRVALERDGLAIDLYQLCEHTGSGVTIPHARIPEFAAKASALSRL